MILSYKTPASIECDTASIKTRKIEPRPPIFEERLESIVYPFKLSLNSEAIIKKELNPKKPIIDSSSKLNIGEGISGEMIAGFSLNGIGRDNTVKRGSSRHKASFLDVNGFVYAKLEKPYRGIREMKPCLLDS